MCSQDSILIGGGQPISSIDPRLAGKKLRPAIQAVISRPAMKKFFGGIGAALQIESDRQYKRELESNNRHIDG